MFHKVIVGATIYVEVNTNLEGWESDKTCLLEIVFEICVIMMAQ